MAKDARTNRRIRAREVRVIGPNSEQLGILSLDEALRQALEAGMDLVEVSPMAKPPVCKIMDYGKAKYEAKKKANEAKKKQAVVRMKEVKLRPKTEDHDYDFKVKNIRRFLEEGDKAKVTIMFRGRELAHKDFGQRILLEVMEDLKEVAIVESTPRMEGRSMYMILAPNPKARQAHAHSQASRPPSTPAPAPAAPTAPAPQTAPAAPAAQTAPAAPQPVPATKTP